MPCSSAAAWLTLFSKPTASPSANRSSKMTSWNLLADCATKHGRRNLRSCFPSITSSARNSKRTPRRKPSPSPLHPKAGWASISVPRPSKPIVRKLPPQKPSSGTVPWAYSRCPLSRKARSRSPKPSLPPPAPAPLPLSAAAIPSQPFIGPASRTKSPISPPAAALPWNFSPDANFPASKHSPTNEHTDSFAQVGQAFLPVRFVFGGTGMRRRVIAGNWKMYKTLAETRAFFSAFAPLIANSKHCDIIVAPPFTAISTAAEAAKGTNITISGQNVSWSKEGAFTGEVSAPMLAEAGCRYVIIGHSERRQLFRETDDNVAKKTLMALDSGLTPIVCLGETQEDRDAGLTEQVLSRQFTGGPGALTPEEFSRILVAYEPVWAIGTGRTATPEIAAEAHRFLRRCAGEKFSVRHASALRILYGGSVKPDNIQGLMAQEELDGALVGGASLDPKSFAAIVNFK